MSMAELPHLFKQQLKEQPIVIVMGVSGCGKSTIGKALATEMNLNFFDADDFHPQANVKKMSQGIALNDDDRWPWLKILSQAIAKEASQNGGVVSACSALKRSYRDFIVAEVNKPLIFVVLDGSKELILQRMKKRRNHYMPPSLLESQIADFEPPESDESFITCSIDNSIEQIVKRVAAHLSEA
jgi:gluconokinase